VRGRLDVLHTVEEGDFVAVHSRVQHASWWSWRRARASVPIRGDRIAERWDVGQEVPADTVSRNGMFW